MSTSWTFVAAIPPTLGHADMISFANHLRPGAKVIFVTRPNEPFSKERYDSLVEHFAGTGVQFLRVQVESETDEGNEFWAEKLLALGFAKGDVLVSSEHWGWDLAERLGADFFPYDEGRFIRFTKGTQVRSDLVANWEWILPEFQQRLQKRVVIFGAESVGKSTLTGLLRRSHRHATETFEYARPLLTANPELDVAAMTRIWEGQKALQQTAIRMLAHPRVVFHDTDLFSTLGYWEFWKPDEVPEELAADAMASAADLYILLPSNIPFEADPIRYGGTKREQSDDYWESVLQKYNLPYMKVESADMLSRAVEVNTRLQELLPTTIDFVRKGNS